MNAPRRSFLRSGTGLIALYLFLAAAAAVKIGIHEFRASALIDQIVARQDLNNVATMDVNLNRSHLGFFTHFFVKLVYPGKTSVAAVMENERDIVSLIGDLKMEFLSSADAALALVGFSLLFLFAATAGAAPGPEANLRRIYSLLSVSLIFFVLGISCPVLTAVVKGEHNLVGGFFIETSSKGIVSTVVSLLRSADWVIAILLTGFSICIPIFKGIATLVACRSGSDERRRRTARFLEAIGKWSLTDVMVAAVLLGCFSLNAIHETDGGVVAVPRFALGFFIAYCVLAARTSYLLKSAVRSGPRGQPAGPAAGGAALLACSVLAGGAFGYFIFDNFSYGRTLGDVALVKLVRAHEELLETKISVSPDHPANLSFATPFRGVVTVTVTPHRKFTLETSLARDGRPLPRFAASGETRLERAQRLPAGKYELTLRNLSSGEVLQSDAVSVHITLDP